MLHIAASNGQKATSEMLLEKGANINAKDQSGKTPLNHAFHNDKQVVMGLLLIREANVAKKDDERLVKKLKSTFPQEIVDLIEEEKIDSLYRRRLMDFLKEQRDPKKHYMMLH